MLRAVLVAAALILPCAGVSGAQRGIHMPTRFQGEWNEKRADCGTDRNASRLIIANNGVNFYENLYEYQRVQVIGDRAVVRLTSPEGDNQYTWDLERGGRVLNQREGAQSYRRVRC